MPTRDLYIHLDTLRKTKDCPKNFRCLDADDPGTCPVVACIDRKVYLVECKSPNQCPYKIAWGADYTCTCPTRKEIFNRYGT